MKSFKILAIAATLASTAATAGTYSTTLTIEDLSKVLVSEETTGMQFPIIVLDGTTIAGDDCYTNESAANYIELCPSSVGKTNAKFTLTGTPYAAVGVQLDTTPQTIEGIEFIPYNLLSGATLNSSGTAIHTVAGRLSLVDRAAVTSSNITFTYNLEFVAQ